MAPTAEAFVRSAMEALGCDGPAAFARAMGYGPGGDKRVSRWLKGENEPDFEATMAILDKTNWLTNGDTGRVDPMSQAAEVVRRLSAGERLDLDQVDLLADEMLGIAAEGIRVAGELHKAARTVREST